MLASVYVKTKIKLESNYHKNDYVKEDPVRHVTVKSRSWLSSAQDLGSSSKNLKIYTTTTNNFQQSNAPRLVIMQNEIL